MSLPLFGLRVPSVSPWLLSLTLLIGAVGCSDDDPVTPPTARVDGGASDAGSDDTSGSDSTLSDLGGDGAVADIGNDLIVTDTSTDTQIVPPDMTPTCPTGKFWNGSVCACPSNRIELGDRCVICVENDQCGSQVCVNNTCRACQTHAECGALFCGDNGNCTDVAPACLSEGQRRCQNHAVQYCRSETWVDDTENECPFGCDGDSGACYGDTNVGWIGGRCEGDDDCVRVGDAALCLPPSDGFVEGTCSQSCTSTCPDQFGDNDTVTFCVDSEGLLVDEFGLADAGICVSHCDFGLFADTGCRPGYECRPLERANGDGTFNSVCLPFNWWRNPSRVFDYGVASGEVTSSTSIVWTHVGASESEGEVHYGTAEGNLDGRASFTVSSDDGFTTQVALSGLSPERLYYFQFVLEGDVRSPVGSFRTAPLADSNTPIRFVISGDLHQDHRHTWDIFNHMLAEEPDFFVQLGDWPYADAPVSLADYRRMNESMRIDTRIIDFMAEVPVYAIFDDHEVNNDWDAAFAAANPVETANGLKVWSEWWPLEEQVNDEYYRRFRQGDLEFFFLDTRTHRDAESATDDEDKQMLGEAQIQWLYDALLDSDATVKFVITSVPLEFATNGPDAWVGYTTERDRILGEIISNPAYGGTVFLTADQHWFSSHHYLNGIKEFQFGPLSANTRAPGPDPTGQRVYVNRTYNYGLIEWDPVEETFEVTGFDQFGEAFYSELVAGGRGQLEVTNSTGGEVGFSICDEDPGPTCAHRFIGVSPTTLGFATPGDYDIHWQDFSAYVAPNNEVATLLDGETLTFHGEYSGSGLELPWSDSFDSNSGWTVVDEGQTDAPSAWSWGSTAPSNADNPSLFQGANIYDVNNDSLPRLGSLVHNGNPSWTDYTIDLKFYPQDDDSVGVVFRYRNSLNYYRLSFDAQRSEVRLVMREDGVFTLLADELSTPVYNQDAWNSLSVTVEGTTLSATLNGTSVFNGVSVDPLNVHTAGTIGMYVWGMGGASAGEGIYFDELTVTAP